MALPRNQTQIIRQLNEFGHLTREQAGTIISRDNLSGQEMEKLLMEEFKISRFQILVAKARAHDLSPFNARKFKAEKENFMELEKPFCAEKMMLPVGKVGGYQVIAVSDPFRVTDVVAAVQEELAKRRRKKGENGQLQGPPPSEIPVSVLLALEDDIRPHLEQKQEQQRVVGFDDVMQGIEDQFGDDGEIQESDLEEESAPIIQLANSIIEDAYLSGGSDIHIEPFETFARVRVRVDGVCAEKLRLPPRVCSALMARLKVMANLDIAEKRLPQDGRIVYKQFNRKGLDLDLRVSTAPLNHGEGTVMRILDKQKSTLPLPMLGFSEKNLSVYRDLIQRPYGMILHCGPTGSGKSMTLYSALNEINSPDICIRTAEDPIEYTLEGLLQMQMHRKIGLTFAAALRAFLRQDPDIILVGEIRDTETAQIAVEAALTGHMLFSTLHTNDAPSTIARLTEMHIESFMISAALTCVCAQRLMRRVCKVCKTEYMPEGREAEILQNALGWVGPIYGPPPKTSNSSSSCPKCGGSGYKGRVGIHELMATSPELVKAVNAEMEAAKLKKVAIRNGMKTLHQDSMMKVQDGISSMEESISTVPPDTENFAHIINAETMEEALLD